MNAEFDTVEDALKAIAAGEMIVVADDDDRENEGDLIMAASKATPEAVAFMIRHTSGILCAPLLEEQAGSLHLDPMVARNDAPMSTAFTVSIDYKKGLTTGISAEERAATVQALTNSNVAAEDFVRQAIYFLLCLEKGACWFVQATLKLGQIWRLLLAYHQLDFWQSWLMMMEQCSVFLNFLNLLININSRLFPLLT